MLLASFWNTFVELFTGMGVAAGVCLSLGILLCLIEIFQPGFGIFGGTGVVLIIAGITIRMIQDGNLLMLFIMVFLIVLIILTAFLIMVRSMKYGWLSRTALVQKGTAVDENFSEGTKDFKELLGKSGVTTTPLRPSGKINIDGKEYDVVAKSSFIDKDSSVIVDEIEGVRIVVVEKINNK